MASSAAPLERTGQFDLAPTASAVAHAQFVQNLHAATPRLFVTHVLIAINVAVFVITLLSNLFPDLPTNEQVITWGANYGPATLNGEWWRLVTSMFVHFGILHVAMNMWALWQIGRLVERFVGNIGFLLLYAASGIGGSLASLWWHPVVHSAGASGAIFGVIGALAGYVVMQRKSMPTEFVRLLRKDGITFLIYCAVIAFAIPNIDHAAHFGGLLTGVLCGVVISQPVTDNMWFGRVVRNGLLAVLATVGIVAAVFAMPPAPVDGDTVTEDLNATLRTYYDAAKRHDGGELTDAAFADLLEHDVLPPWKRSIADTKTLLTQPSVNKPVVEQLLDVEVKQQQAWFKLTAALREVDPDGKRKLMVQFRLAQREADKAFASQQEAEDAH